MVPLLFTIPPFKANNAINVAERVRFNDPGVIDHAAEEFVGGLGGHQHLSAIGAHELLVLDQRIHGPLSDGEAHQAVAVEVERNLVARA